MNFVIWFTKEKNEINEFYGYNNYPWVSNKFRINEFINYNDLKK